MPAINLEQALTIFNPAALRAGDLGLYYVERPESPLKLMELQLRNQRRLKALFTGHRGAGKTTALNCLASRLTDRFFVIHFSVLDTLNAYDVHYTDLMLALAARLLGQATDKKYFPKGLRKLVKEELLDDVLLWLQERVQGLQFTPSEEQNLGIQVNALAVQLETKLSREPVTRQALRERVSMHLSELLDKMDYVIGEVERRTEMQVLFIVEDIDKLDLENARSLFLEHARSLAAPAASIIYTFPVALLYSPHFTQIMANFGYRFILPNVRLRNRAGAPDDQGLGTLEEIFYRRLDRDLIEPQALQALIEGSGGVVGTLVRLGNLAAARALVNGKTAIDLSSAEDAMGELRGDFKALLSQGDRAVLRACLAGEDLSNEEPVRGLLYTGLLLEYRNHEPWFGVHPLARPLLEE